MRAGAKFKDKLGTIRTHLTSMDNQPLGKAVLVIIIFLDIFILVSIFNGLDAHTKQLSSPDAYIPYTCREIVVNRQWNSTNRIDNLSQIIISSSTSDYQEEDKKIERHPVCVPYLDLVDQIKSDKALVGIFEERNKSELEAGELQREIDNLKGAYDTSLLETIAKKQESQTKVNATKEDFIKKTAALDSLKTKIASVERSINSDGKIKLLWEKLQTLQEQDRQKLLTDLRTMNFWYPVKKLGMQMIFLLPLFIVFYAWNNASIRKNRGLQTLVSSHLLGISFIPILCKIIETVYDIIPKKLLKKLMDLLESLKLVAIWHYFVIGLAVAAALFLVYIFQKKLFSREKLIERRISKGDCQQCGKHLPAGSTACPFCGFVQYKPCSKCHNQMHVHGKFCRECGHRATD
ncbi:MAG TPA: zinc ribbon domain-containing protein [Geobacteraceae bacterium]|nr:zinc ribbon domain-containing protein [Geobacteraceae bacterium]